MNINSCTDHISETNNFMNDKSETKDNMITIKSILTV